MFQDSLFLFPREDTREAFRAFWDVKPFNHYEYSFNGFAFILQKFIASWKLLLTHQSQISIFGHALVSCLFFVNSPSVFSSFTPILLTVFSTSVSRGRLAPLWEQPGSQPLGSWPTSESMFDKGRVSPWAKDGELERLLHGERATRKARGCRVHIPCHRQIANPRSGSLPLIKKIKLLTSQVFPPLRSPC